MQRVLTREGELAAKLRTKQATIGVVGLGYVGLPLVIRMIVTGYDVVGFDIDQRKVDLLKVGKGYINHIPESDILDVVMSGRFLATTDFAHIARVDAILLCVPTPLGEHREPDLSYIVSTVESILPHIHEGQLISLESTTYPGTTREEICRRLEDHGHRIGEDVHVVYSPEREDPANPNFNTQTIPKVVGGATPACLEAGCALYGNIVDRVVPVSSLEVAEMTKLLENIYRAVNIGLVNELKIVADRMGVDIWEVIEAAKTKPFGFTAFYPGPGLGGHCIPIDPFYLTWKAHEYGVHTRFIELAGEVNAGMPKWVIGKVQDALNEEGKALRGSKILVLGIAYKKNLDDMRESPSVELMELLSEKGAEVSYSDPYLPRFPRMRRHHFDLVSQDITAESLATFDCVLLATDHDDFDYELIQEHAQLVIDTRGRFNRQLPQVIAA